MNDVVILNVNIKKYGLIHVRTTYYLNIDLVDTGHNDHDFVYSVIYRECEDVTYDSFIMDLVHIKMGG